MHLIALFDEGMLARGLEIGAKKRTGQQSGVPVILLPFRVNEFGCGLAGVWARLVLRVHTT